VCAARSIQVPFWYELTRPSEQRCDAARFSLRITRFLRTRCIVHL
jgi:hypothetical protein